MHEIERYVKRNKSDAEAICEAATRPDMRFVPVRTPEQQSVLKLHRTRQLFVRQRTMLINAIRAHLAELGIVAGVGRNGVEILSGRSLMDDMSPLITLCGRATIRSKTAQNKLETRRRRAWMNGLVSMRARPRFQNDGSVWRSVRNVS